MEKLFNYQSKTDFAQFKNLNRLVQVAYRFKWPLWEHQQVKEAALEGLKSVNSVNVLSFLLKASLIFRVKIDGL